ncbi:hypothetical protein ZIOFF_057833 [Zingiber officinale]|uniref:Uncharacterized protein n=2 Tax=Zingiber officinale TaxID=94328 RepID=A0A8J5F7Q5_ZINOF|nr:hypothetical protein ZIOFF_057833 [Zingiber officinale]
MSKRIKRTPEIDHRRDRAMGCCFSSAAATSVDSSTRPSTAKVIGLDGSLTEHPVPLTASQVIIASAGASFVCSSDGLFPGAPIPALEPGAPLRSGQIYFVLPSTKLAYPLSASDMAALFMTASSALSSVSAKKRRRATTWEMPVAEFDEVMCEIINENSGSTPATINSELLRRKPVSRRKEVMMPTIDEVDEGSSRNGRAVASL